MKEPPHARFARWIEQQEGSQATIAKLLGCEQAFVSYVARGQRTPGLNIALGIERLTSAWKDGPIKAAEWLSANRGAA